MRAREISTVITRRPVTSCCCKVVALGEATARRPSGRSLATPFRSHATKPCETWVGTARQPPTIGQRTSRVRRARRLRLTDSTSVDTDQYIIASSACPPPLIVTSSTAHWTTHVVASPRPASMLAMISGPRTIINRKFEGDEGAANGGSLDWPPSRRHINCTHEVITSLRMTKCRRRRCSFLCVADGRRPTIACTPTFRLSPTSPLRANTCRCIARNYTAHWFKCFERL